MFESQNSTPPPFGESPSIITGGPGQSGPHWFMRLWRRIWPQNASPRRKLLVIGAAVVVIAAVALLLFLLLRQPAQTPKGQAPAPVAEEKQDTSPPTPDPNQQPEAPKPNPSAPTPQPGGTGNQGTTGGETGGSTGGGTSGGGSEGSGGSEGGGSTSSCPLPSYPNPNCTGVPAGTSLTQYSGDFITSAPGQVIDGMRITGDLTIQHSGVVIRNSEIYGHVKNTAGQESFVIQNSTIGPPSGCFTDAAVGNNNYTATSVRLRGFAEGFRVEDASNVVVRHSFIKFCNPNSDNHGDALQGYLGGSNVVFEHNTVDMLDIPVETDYITAVVFWSDNSGNNLTFKDNLISGGSYSIRIHVGSGHVVTGNRVINNSWLYGPVSSSCSNIAWSDNSIVEIDANYNVTNTVSQLNCAE